MANLDGGMRPVWRSEMIWAKEFNSLGLIFSAVTQGGNPTAIFTPGSVPTGVIAFAGAPTMTALTLTQGPPVTYDGTSSTLTHGASPPTIVISHGSTGTIAVTKGTADTVASAIGDADNALTLIAEINSLKVNGALMNTDGMTVRTLWSVPADMNTQHPMYARVKWDSGSSDITDTLLWTLTRKNLVNNTTALSATVSTAPDTVLVADTPSATAWTVQVTAPAKFNAGTFSHGTIQIFMVEMTTKAVALAEASHFLGLELLYVPHVSAEYRSGIPIANGSPRTPALPADWV